MESAVVDYVLNKREYQLLLKLIQKTPLKAFSSGKAYEGEPSHRYDNFNVAAFRAASRVYLVTNGSLKLADALLARIAARRAGGTVTAYPPKPIVASSHRLALSLSGLMFFHRVLYRLFSRVRAQLLHEKVKNIKERYPYIHSILTNKFAPAVGASLSGFALGLCPADQLRLTIAIFIASRALEIGYTTLEGAGLIKKYKPWWLGSWTIFALSYGQMFYAFVFDRDCAPPAFGPFLLNHSPEYVQKRPSDLSPKVTWPNSDQIVDALAEMARLQSPPFISPILHPGSTNTLPKSIGSAIAPITSRADPAHQYLSCALLHPSDPSGVMAYLRQNLLAFPQLARFFALYYGAFSLMRYKDFINSPVASFNGLAKQILASTAAISGTIGASWASISLFAAILPRTFIPKFRFFLGGFLAGHFHALDRSPPGYMNIMYAARLSVDSLWKQGLKNGWWKGIQGGDVLLFAASVALMNMAYDWRSQDLKADRISTVLKVLRGEIDLGLQDKAADKAENKLDENLKDDEVQKEIKEE